MFSTLYKLVGVSLLILTLSSCDSGDDSSDSSTQDFTTIKYDYQWPSTSSLDGYKIRFTDTVFVKADRLFQEFLQDGYSHAFVYDFTKYPGTDQYEIYGYENDNLKYSSYYYTVSAYAADNKETISFTTNYYYKDVSGVDLEGSDRCELYPTSATGGTYMCWGKYPGLNPLYDAKTGKYDLVSDPTAP